MYVILWIEVAGTEDVFGPFPSKYEAEKALQEMDANFQYKDGLELRVMEVTEPLDFRNMPNKYREPGE